MPLYSVRVLAHDVSRFTGESVQLDFDYICVIASSFADAVANVVGIPVHAEFVSQVVFDCEQFGWYSYQLFGSSGYYGMAFVEREV